MNNQKPSSRVCLRPSVSPAWRNGAILCAATIAFQLAGSQATAEEVRHAVNPTSRAECQAIRQQNNANAQRLTTEARRLHQQGLERQRRDGYLSASPIYRQSRELFDRANELSRAGTAAASRCEAMVAAQARAQREVQRREDEASRAASGHSGLSGPQGTARGTIGLAGGEPASANLARYHEYVERGLTRPALDILGVAGSRRDQIARSLEMIQGEQQGALLDFERTMANVATFGPSTTPGVVRGSIDTAFDASRRNVDDLLRTMIDPSDVGLDFVPSPLWEETLARLDAMTSDRDSRVEATRASIQREVDARRAEVARANAQAAQRRADQVRAQAQAQARAQANADQRWREEQDRQWRARQAQQRAESNAMWGAIGQAVGQAIINRNIPSGGDAYRGTTPTYHGRAICSRGTRGSPGACQ